MSKAKVVKKSKSSKKDDRSMDHKKIGQDLELFFVSQEVGPGFPIFAPKGATLRREVENYIREEKEKRGYQFVWTPHIAKTDLYKKSGHWQKYDAMFPEIKLDKVSYVLKPMNCPHHFQVYLAKPRSYRDLPLRIAENGTVYRYEKSGEVNGLLRVRALTIDDTHTFVRESQIADELDEVLALMEKLFKSFGFDNYRAQISVRDAKESSKYLGSKKVWEKAEKALVEACKKRDIDYSLEMGEAAFYGPKIDLMVKDSLGREWQLSTAQLDFNQPENFDMTYVNEAGEKERPAILHIAVLGSVERFIAILLEHYKGSVPVWMAPVHAKVIPITERNIAYAKKLSAELGETGLRTEVDTRSNTLSSKILDAQKEKVPYMLVVGDKEEKVQKIAVRPRSGKDLGLMDVADFIRRVNGKIKDKSLDL